MPEIEEQRIDIIERCDELLDGVLSSFEEMDSTPEGRMISQLKWLKERAAMKSLSLPVDNDMLSTLRYIYTDGELCRHASNPDDKQKVWSEIERPMSQLLSLTKHANLLSKHEYFPYIILTMDKLATILKDSPRKLSNVESKFLSDLIKLRKKINDGELRPPYTIISYMPDFESFIDIDSANGLTIADLYGAEELIRIIQKFIFNGVRPDSWLTPKDADRETQKFV